MPDTMEGHGEKDKWWAETPLLEEGRRRVEEDKQKQEQEETNTFKMVALSSLLCATLFILYSRATPVKTDPYQGRDFKLEILHSGEDVLKPALPRDFPDPSVAQDHDGTWYAFATNSGGRNVQVAKASGSGRDPLGEWTRLDVDAMPDRSWTTGRNTWAPDVKMLPDGSFIMYFSGELPSHQHCIGVARSPTITGPYKPDAEPWACPREAGGAIDASGFFDQATGSRYVVYKVDGNSKPGFSPCGKGVNDPKLRTPLMLQEVDVYDGTTKRGEPIELLDRVAAEDGALIEAPDITRLSDGTYVLFFSSHCFNDPKYDIKYAWSYSVTGPYRRGTQPLLRTSEFGLHAPGGVTTGKIRGFLGDKDFMGFHGNCQGKGRCFYTVRWGEA